MSEARIQAYRDASERVALRQNAEPFYINGELLDIATVPAWQRRYQKPVCYACLSRRCTAECIESIIEWWGLWPFCCSEPACCSHESYRIA